VFVAFIIDVFSRMIVGWQASKSLQSDLAIDALEMAVHNRGGDGLDGVVHHSDPQLPAGAFGCGRAERSERGCARGHLGATLGTSPRAPPAPPLPASVVRRLRRGPSLDRRSEATVRFRLEGQLWVR
jgi:putative transposase